MKLLNYLKYKIAWLILSNKLDEKTKEEKSFSNFFKNSNSFFIIMPNSEEDFHYALDILDSLFSSNKINYIFTNDYRVSSIPHKYQSKIIDYGISDVNRLGLPVKSLRQKLSALKFDAVIDLNREENLFYSYTANLVQSTIRIGFSKKKSDLYYNMQLSNYSDNAEISYKNLLNCLQMF